MGVGVGPRGGRVLAGLGERGVSLQLHEVSVGVGVGVLLQEVSFGVGVGALLQPRVGVGVVEGAPLHPLLGVGVGEVVGAARSGLSSGLCLGLEF